MKSRKELMEEYKVGELESRDLSFHPSIFEEVQTFYEWELRPEVTEFFSIRDGQTFEEVMTKYLNDKANPQMQQYTICLKADDPETGKKAGEPIGRIVIGDIEEGWKAELWRIYIADPALRGKGLGLQAMLWTMKHMFEEMGLERMYLDHYTGNPASRLYLGLGFRYEGVLRKNCRKNGVLYDVHLMSMLKDEYFG